MKKIRADLFYIFKYNKLLISEILDKNYNLVGFEILLGNKYGVLYWYKGEHRTNTLYQRLLSYTNKKP